MTASVPSKDITPYWNDECIKISARLSSPDEIVDAIQYSNKTVEGSWFSAVLKYLHQEDSTKLFSAASTESMFSDISLNETIRRSRKIRIYPKEWTRESFKRWFGIQRYVYNQTVEYLKGINGPRPSWTAVGKTVLDKLPSFCDTVPYQIKKIAVKDACTALTNGKKKAKATGEPFKLHFKSRKDPVQSCFIPKSAISQNGIYPVVSGHGLRYSESIDVGWDDARLILHNGRYYLTVPRMVQTTRTENQGRVVAIDPGVRSFLSFYSETSIGQIGTHDIGRIQRLCEYLDDLISKISQAPSRQKRRMRRAADRIRWKVRDLVDELHHKAARFLVDNFDIILLPTFEVQGMVVRKARKLRRKSVRQMLTWAHFRFKQFLKSKAFETGKLVMDVNEAYTSKTNSWTGEIMNVGGREWITVEGLKINRDINGARGIFLRALGDSPALKACVVNES